VSGIGSVTFNLIEKQTRNILATRNIELTENLTLISHDEFQKTNITPAICSLEAIVNGEYKEKPIKVLALIVTMDPK